MRILLVEDDPMIGAEIVAGLRDAAYAADWVKDGQAAVLAFSSEQHDLVLLDLGLPKRDGMEVLHDIRRKHASVPLIIISARDQLDARLEGLDGGADDYLLKPFALSELLARIRAVYRRRAGSGRAVLSNGLVSLDPATHEARMGDAAPVVLSNREFALLQALLVRPGAILSRMELEEKIYGWGEEVESNAVEFLIHAIRKKLAVQVIRNVRGVGWMVPKSE